MKILSTHSDTFFDSSSFCLGSPFFLSCGVAVASHKLCKLFFVKLLLHFLIATRGGAMVLQVESEVLAPFAKAAATPDVASKPSASVWPFKTDPTAHTLSTRAGHMRRTVHTKLNPPMGALGVELDMCKVAHVTCKGCQCAHRWAGRSGLLTSKWVRSAVSTAPSAQQPSTPIDNSEFSCPGVRSRLAKSDSAPDQRIAVLAQTHAPPVLLRAPGRPIDILDPSALPAELQVSPTPGWLKQFWLDS